MLSVGLRYQIQRIYFVSFRAFRGLCPLGKVTGRSEYSLFQYFSDMLSVHPQPASQSFLLPSQFLAMVYPCAYSWSFLRNYSFQSCIRRTQPRVELLKSEPFWRQVRSNGTTRVTMKRRPLFTLLASCLGLVTLARAKTTVNLAIASGFVSIPICHLVPAKVMATEVKSDEAAMVVSRHKSGIKKRAHD